MLQTRDHWEYGYGNDLLSAVFKQQGIRQYPMVEITPGGPLIFVSLNSDDNISQLSGRTLLMVHNWMALMDLLKHPDAVRPAITLLFEDKSSGTYRSCKVQEIIEDVNSRGEVIYLCKSHDHIVYRRETIIKSSETKLMPRVLWRQAMD